MTKTINDHKFPKTQPGFLEIPDIQELLASGLFSKGIAKKHIFVNDDLTAIQYNCKNNAEQKLSGPETFVQAASFLKLVFEYDYLPQNISINESVQIGSETSKADILVYNEKNNGILIIVECKGEETNERQFQAAVDQAYSYAYARAASYIWVTSGIKNEYFEISNVSPFERITAADIPKRDGKVQQYKYIKGQRGPIESTQGELIQKFKLAHDALWGGGALAPITAFDELNKLIFCKIWDERRDENNPESKGEPYNFQIIYYPEDKENRGSVKAKTELEKRIRLLYEEGRKKDPEIFKDDIKLDKNKIFTVVQYLQDINISKTNLDARGLAFQGFIADFFRGDLGQFFTPNTIAQFIVKAIGVKKEYKVLDTSCGSGGFLLHALRAIREEAKDISDSGKQYNYWHEFAEKRLFGIEINEQISRAAKINMIIHGDGHTNVIANNGLKNNQSIEIENRSLNFQDGTFDLIMTNPPCGSVIKADEANYYKEYELFKKNWGIAELEDRVIDNGNKNKWRISQSAEILFLERCYKYLKEGGYLAIIIPDGILTNSTSQYVRDWLIEKFRLIAVVSLPQHAFAHAKTGVKSSVLFLKKYPELLTKQLETTLGDIKAQVREEKGLDKETKEERVLELYREKAVQYTQKYTVAMIQVKNIGYDAAGKKTEENELPEIANRIRDFIIKEGL